MSAPTSTSGPGSDQGGSASPAIDRVVVLVMDSCGVGELPDADRYGDRGAHTLGHVAEYALAHDGQVALPTLQRLGLANITSLPGLAPAERPAGAFGKCAEVSAGKDTSTGHWEIAGLKIDKAFPLYPDGFPAEILDPFRARTGREVLGNRPASGTQIIDELGAEHMRTGALIVYTSGDSVFQIAAHEEVVPLPELYRACEIARDILDPYHVGRVIARPFVGPGPGQFQRTYNRHDYSMPPPAPTVLDSLADAGVPVVGVGKIHDIYAGRGVTETVKSEGNADGMDKTLGLLDRVERGLIFNNLVDFDALYGHRRNPGGYYHCLQEFDAQLAALVAALRPDRDLLVITADHGNDPTMPGTDHTREYVPLLAYGPAGAAGVALGTRASFADIGATVADVFDVTPPPQGTSFLPALGGPAPEA
ncbi:phosphopentomutase [Haliangium sp.]|uniref:phosphopentomutase n=1 Tax=Haliangium sp. TaxID=2663208 RepID=UPI003D13C1E1